MQALSGAAWLAAGRVAGDALAFALFVLVAREFGPVGTGIYAFTFAVATILHELVSLGIDDYGVREYARRPAVSRSALLGSLVGAQSLLAAGTACLVLLGGLVTGKVHLPLLVFMVVYQLAFAIARTLFIPAFVAGKPSIQILAETVVRASVLGVACAMALTAGEPSLVLVLAGLPVFGVALLVAAAASARRFAGPVRARWSALELAEVAREIWPFAAANFLSGLYARTGVLVLFVVAGNVQAGLFASAYKFAEVGWALLMLIPAAAYPLLTRLIHADPRESRAFTNGLLGVTLLCTGIVAWAIYWIVPPLMGVVFGQEFQDGAAFARMLAAFVAVVTVAEVLERVLLAADQQTRRLRIVVIQVALNLVLNVLLVPLFGVAGSVASLIASQIVATALLLAEARSHIGLAETMREIAVYAASIAGAVLSGQLLTRPGAVHWVAPVVSLLTFMVIAHAGGLLRLGVPSRTGVLRPAR